MTRTELSKARMSLVWFGKFLRLWLVVKVSMTDQMSKTIYHNTCRVFFPYDSDTAADALLAGHHNS